MPFSRYQIRNEFSLADPELYKAADKDDPEALLEGVAMAGLVGVLRQLGDLAEFAAEIFHGLHEEVMATAARGHGLLTRVQQVESDLPLIERAFLSQTGHSAFFTSSGINWHPNLQTEQNLITKGDLPRFVMDSYEECRGPPRLFLLDKFDVAGAGACLKRYTDPSIYKVEVSSYEMMNAEAQRDKKIRKIKKKGSRLKNGDTPEALQSSHVKLHQLLLEERVQTGANEPARRVKIKKRDIKFPFDTETGKGYMETLLSSPPEDKLVHEVKMVNSPLRVPTKTPEEPEVETLEDKTVNSTLDDVQEKHISVVEENKDGVEDAYQSDDVASETDNYMDALATMESEVETDVEFKAANSDPVVKQETLSDLNLEKIQESQVLDSRSVSDDGSSPMKGKITNFSYSDSDSATTSANNMSPPVNSPHAFASTEIPFRPRALPAQATDNEDLFMDQETTFKESNFKESDLSDVNILTKKGEIKIDPEDVMASVTNEDDNSNSTLVNSHVEEQSFGEKRDPLDFCEDDAVKSESGLAEARVSYSNEDETEMKDEERVSVDSESQSGNVAVCDNDDGKDGDNNNNNNSENEKELDERIPESFSSETKDSVSVTDDTVEKESVEESIISREIDFVPSESIELVESDEKKESSEESDHSKSQILENACDGNDDVDDPEKESLESGEIKESSVESDSIPSAYNDQQNIQFLDANYPEKESVESSEKKESSEEPIISPESDSVPSAYHEIDNNGNETEEPVISPESDSVPSAYHDDSNIESLDSIHNKNENDIVNDNPSTEPIESGENKESSEESVIVLESDSSEETDQNGFQEVYGPDLAESAESQESNSLSIDQNGQTNKQDVVEPPMVDLLLPELAPINMEEMPPLPPLPPMQWRMGRSQNPSMMSMPGGSHADIIHVTQNEISRNEKFVEEVIKEESPKESQKDPISEPEIIRLPSTSSLPSGDDELPNGIRPMKVQRPRTPLIDAVAAHDKNKLRKVSERAVPLFPKEEEKDTFLEQIRAKSFNLKPAAPTRPIIQGPTTNLRVAAILEKANAIRQAFAGSDDDEDGSDSWSE